jgi:hypothetical protein
MRWVMARGWAFGCLLVAVLAFSVAYLEYDEGRTLDGAPTAPAVIRDVVNPVKGRQYLEVDVALPDGRTVRTNLSDFYDVPRPKKGGQVQVQYRSDGSGLLAREAGIGPDRTGEIGWVTAGLVTMLVGLGILVRHTRRWRKRTWR